MNYIKHLSAFFEKIADDGEFTPFHISLYLALFQLWNAQRFVNPVNASRFELLQMSKIGSIHTYYRCINDLHRWNYIQYFPSKSSVRSSEFHLCIFDTSDAQAVHPTCSKNDTSCAQPVHPIYKTNTNSNKVNEREDSFTSVKNFIIPHQCEIEDFFKKENYPLLEARKFFNHFQSIGWKVGGKSPMEDWHAAAHKWILNDIKRPQQPTTKINHDKNYSEPL